MSIGVASGLFVAAAVNFAVGQELVAAILAAIGFAGVVLGSVRYGYMQAREDRAKSTASETRRSQQHGP